MDDGTRAEPAGAPVELARRSALSLSPRQQVSLLAVVGAVTLALLFGLPAVGRMLEPKAPPAPPPPPPGTFRATADQMATMKFTTVEPLDFRRGVETEGKIATNDDRSTSVFSPFSGRVTHVFAKVGDAVRAGQPLFAIAASEFVQGQTDLAAARAQLTIARAAEARQQSLYKVNGAALKDWQQSEADLANAEANMAAVRNRLRIMGASEALIAALDSRPIDRAGSAETVVASPISGVVLQRNIGAGQNLGSVTNGGSTAAFMVSDLSSVWLVGNVREVDAPLAKVGQPIEVRATALPGRVFTAKVDYVSPTVDPVSRRVTVRATIANPDGALKPEMFASFNLITGGVAKAVAVPADAVIYEGDTARVWVVRSGGALELRTIHAGETQDGMVEVASGLASGERVVTGGALFIDRASKAD